VCIYALIIYDHTYSVDSLKCRFPIVAPHIDAICTYRYICVYVFYVYICVFIMYDYTLYVCI